MDLISLKSKNIYNLIVSADETAWESGTYEMDRSRFLEYTSDNIYAIFKNLDNNTIAKIGKLPCLFLYELGRGDCGYIGYITNIKVRVKKIIFKYEIITSISIDDVEKLAFELDIDVNQKYITELHRTHWAIKEVNLLQELQEYDQSLIPNISKPKVFVSYSQSLPETRERVNYLVEHLEANGVDVIYDRKALNLGNSMTFFMENLANDPSIKKVLVICDKSYAHKANTRMNGVGTETELIVSDVYGNPLQNKIIPVFFEKDKNGNFYVPTFLKNIYGVDLTLGNEQNCQILLQNIFS